MTTAMAKPPVSEAKTTSEFEKLLEMPAGFERLEEAARLCSEERLAGMSSMKRAYTVAKSVELMRRLLTDEVMAVFMQLMDTPVGFRTDHGPGCKDKAGKQLAPYTVAVVRECLIHAFMSGLMATGNMFNIISRRMYITKEGFTYKIHELPDVTDPKMVLDVPKMVTGGATVKATMTWVKKQVTNLVTREFPIRVNSGMGADAILGKAERKIRAAAYAQMTGSDPLPEGDVDDDLPPAVSAEAKPSLVERVRGAEQPTKPTVGPPWKLLMFDFARAKDWKDSDATTYLNGVSQRTYEKGFRDLSLEQLNALRAQVMPPPVEQHPDNTGQSARPS